MEEVNFGIYRVYKVRAGKTLHVPKSAVEMFGWKEGDIILFSKHGDTIYMRKPEALSAQTLTKHCLSYRILRKNKYSYRVSIPADMSKDLPEWVVVKAVKLIEDDDSYHALAITPI